MCYTDTDSFILYIKTVDITNIYKLGGKIKTKFAGLRVKTYTYLIDEGSADKKAKDKTKCVIKRKRKFQSKKNSLEATELENKINYLEKNKININSIKKIIKNWWKTINQYKKDRKGLKVNDTMFFLEKLTR